MGVGIKGLRFPLAESGLSECARSKLDPDVGLCAAIQAAAAAAAATQQALSASQPAGRPLSQPISQPPCSQTWQETLLVRAWDRGPAPNKRILTQSQSIISLHAVIYLTLGLCLYPLFVFTRPLVCYSSLAPCSWASWWRRNDVMDANRLLAGVMLLADWHINVAMVLTDIQMIYLIVLYRGTV